MIAIVTTVCFIYCISADSKTCCYGSKCPLPVFNQFNGNFSGLKSFGVIDESACCPKGCWFSSGSIDTITRYGTVDTSCICNCDQECNAEPINCLNGYCSALAGAETCDNWSPNEVGCPDKYTDNIDGTGSGSNLPNYCTYNHGEDVAPMSQRCLPTTICFENWPYNGTVDGTYVKNGFYNGFPNYIGDNFMIRVESTYDAAVWAVVSPERAADGTVDGFISPYCQTDFNNITSWDYTKCSGNVYISNGQCIYPTPEPTAYQEYNTPSPTSQDMNSTESSQNDFTLMIAGVVVALTLFVLIVSGVVLCLKMKKRNITTPYVKMEAIQHQPKDNNNSSNIIIINQVQQEPEEDDEKQLEGKQENQDVSHSEQQ